MQKLLYFLIFFPLFFVSQKSKAQCSITLSAKASGCYLSAGQSKATVTVEVGWNNAPSGQNIIVTGPAGSIPATRTITPGVITVQYNNTQTTFVNSTQTIVSPQLVAFEIPADGTTGLTLSAAFSSSASCNAISNTVSAPASCIPLSCGANALGGTVFFDFNADGIKQVDEIETGIANVTVTAIDKNGVTYTTTSVKYGRWVLNVPTNAYPLRVEFSGLPNYAREGTNRGTDGNTTVQFISNPDCDVDLGVLNNQDFSDNTPPIFTPCYVNGDPLAGGGASGLDALVSFQYTASGAKDPTKITPLATAAEVGSLWGLAFNKYKKILYASATLRRHVGLGPKGLGGIYVVDPVGASILSSWNVTTDMGVNVGTIPSNSARLLSPGVSTGNEDAEVFQKIGKAGIGDIDINEAGTKLYFTNLFDNKLYEIDLVAYNSSGTTPSAANVASFSIPTPSCVSGNARSFATKWYKGLVYVGVVCDAATSQNKSDLRAYIYRLNPNTNVWTTVFDFPLTYPKGFPTADGLTATGWFPWTDNFDDFIVTNSSANRFDVVYPQPMLTDIEIDVDGSMILGFGDRGGMQTGYRNKHTTDNGNQYTGYVGGDIIRAFNNGSGSFILENAAKAGPVTGYATTNNQGPGFGEFYNDDWYNGDPTPKLRHAECVIGGLALRPGSGEVIVSTIDPVYGVAWSGGVRHYNNQSGQIANSFTIYTTTGGASNNAGTQGKAAGLGDVELGISLPTFIEIGNRVWVDTNQDGIQDPIEAALAGVKVSLYKGGIKIAETTTNAQGEYYFSSKSRNLTPALWTGTGADTSLIASTAYQIVFGETQFASNKLTVGGNEYTLTSANTTTGLANDSNDSDATIITNLPRINITSPISGAVNHTYDAGFILILPCTPPTATASATNATCTGPTANSNASITIAAFTSGQRYRYSTGGSFNSGSATPGSITAIPSGGVIVNSLPNTATTYTVRIYDATDDACFIDRVVNTTVTNCSCPVVAAPAVGNAARCGTGTLTASIASTCASGSTLKIFSNTGLTTDVSSQFTITSSNVSSPSISSTTTYYAACVSDAFPTCKSTGDNIVLTINDAPTTTAAATNATCTGPTVNADGSITLTGFTTEKYDYVTGSSYTGTATFATATAIPAGGVIVSNLPNPAVSQAYTVRIFSSAGCFVDRTVTLTATNCLCPVVAAPAVGNASRCGTGTLTASIATACASGSTLQIFSNAGLTTDVTSQFTITASNVTSPSISSTTTYYAACVSDAFPTCKSTGDNIVLTINDAPTTTAAATNATCTGPTVNADGSITLTGFTTEKYDYVTGSSYTGTSTFATATAIPAGGVIVNNLPNPAVSQAYTVRIFSTAGCFVDRVVTITSVSCIAPCPMPNCLGITVIRN